MQIRTEHTHPRTHTHSLAHAQSTLKMYSIQMCKRLAHRLWFIQRTNYLFPNFHYNSSCFAVDFSRYQLELNLNVREHFGINRWPCDWRVRNFSFCSGQRVECDQHLNASMDIFNSEIHWTVAVRWETLSALCSQQFPHFFRMYHENCATPYQDWFLSNQVDNTKSLESKHSIASTTSYSLWFNQHSTFNIW